MEVILSAVAVAIIAGAVVIAALDKVLAYLDRREDRGLARAKVAADVDVVARLEAATVRLDKLERLADTNAVAKMARPFR